MPGAQVSVRTMVPRQAVPVVPVSGRDTFRGARIEASAAPLKPRGVGQILDMAVDVLVSRFGTCVALAVVVLVPLQLGYQAVLSSDLSMDVYWIPSMVWAASLLLSQLLIIALVSALLGRSLMGRPMPIFEFLPLVLRRIPGVLLIAIPVGFISSFGACCCGVGQYIGLWLFAAIPCCYLLEGRGLGDAFSRGFSLIWGWGSLGRWVGWYVVATLMLSPLTSFGTLRSNEFVHQFLLENAPSLFGPVGVVLAIVEATFLGVGYSLIATAYLVYYLDLRVRREGLDLEHRLLQLEARATGGEQ